MCIVVEFIGAVFAAVLYRVVRPLVTATILLATSGIDGRTASLEEGLAVCFGLCALVVRTQQVRGNLTMVQDRSSYVQSDIQDMLDTLKPLRENCKFRQGAGHLEVSSSRMDFFFLL